MCNNEEVWFHSVLEKFATCKLYIVCYSYMFFDITGRNHA